MTRAHFDALVERAWRRIPSRFRDRVQNVAIVVEDEPSQEHLSSGRVPHTHTLLGLYQGVPLRHRSVSAAPLMPDRITLFQGPIERCSGPSDEAIEEQAAVTLFHELGHYFGLNEREVRAMEVRLRRKPRRTRWSQ